MAGEYLMANLKRAEVRRQAVLDWLHQHPGAFMAEIEDGLPQFERLHLRGSVASMVRLREISAEGELKMRQFTAVATITTSAEAMLSGKRIRSRKAYCRRVGKTLDQVHGRESPEAKAARVAGKRAAKEAERAEESEDPVQMIEPWRTRYRCGHTKPAQESRGQGCVRERTTINCHQLY